MDFFEYRNNRLCCEGLDVPAAILPKLAKENIETPVYIYSKATIIHHINTLREALKGIPNTLIAFAVKSNSNLSVLNIMKEQGAGADCVSIGEVLKAVKAGINPKDIIFSGVGKSFLEIKKALELNIGQINVESREEIEIISASLKDLPADKKASIALRINPDIDAKTNNDITTGRKEDKFGVDIDMLPDIFQLIKQNPGIDLAGLSIHIGSQITTIDPFSAAFEKFVRLADELAQGGMQIKTLDFGGGIAAFYNDEQRKNSISPASYGALVKEKIASLKHIDKSKCRFIFEPGRVITANSGILITRVILVKRKPHRNFAVVDAGMNNLLRPALYKAIHEIVPCVINADAEAEKVDIVGPICETSDVFIKDKSMQKLESGDLLCIKTAGAYGAVMSSLYNLRQPAAEILVDGDSFAIIKNSMSLEEVISQDVALERIKYL